MAKELHLNWLLKDAGDEVTRKWLKKIHLWREYILKNNKFIDDDESFLLQLGSKVLRFNASSAFSSIEVYQEIFKENGHFLASGFSGSDARVVFDIGANQGFYIMKLKENNPECKVIAIEPNPYEFGVLSENIKLNGLNNVFLEEKALSSFAGMTSLEIIPQIGAIGGKTVMIPERPWIRDEFIQNVPVKTTTLNELFDKYSIQKADIVKIDVEGMEFEILEKSSVFSRIKKIVVEYHTREIREKIIDLLRSNDFFLVFEDNRENTYYGDLYFKR